MIFSKAYLECAGLLLAGKSFLFKQVSIQLVSLVHAALVFTMRRLRPRGLTALIFTFRACEDFSIAASALAARVLCQTKRVRFLICLICNAQALASQVNRLFSSRCPSAMRWPWPRVLFVIAEALSTYADLYFTCDVCSNRKSNRWRWHLCVGIRWNAGFGLVH